ncbi:HNH endonuclease [Sinorhizobium sp. CB7]
MERDIPAEKPRSSAAIRQQRYRERLSLSASEWDDLRDFIKKRDNYTCGYCGSRLAPLHVDHIIPLIQGGSNDPENLITACLICNTGKSGRTPEQWRDCTWQ